MGQEEIPEIIEETSIIEDDEKIENRETEMEEENETEIEEENENEIRTDLQNDKIGAKYLQVEKSVYFMDYQIYSVEVKNKEMKNLEFYETYEEVKDEGQETIGSRWV